MTGSIEDYHAGLADSDREKDASIFYKSAGEVDLSELERWLEKSRHIAWYYKNILKRKGVLKRLKATTGEWQ